MVRHATRNPEPLLQRCRSRTVAKVDSMGFTYVDGEEWEWNENPANCPTDYKITYARGVSL